MTTAGVSGNRGKVGGLIGDACMVVPIGFAAGSDSAGVIPVDMATIAVEMFIAAVERVDESSIFDAGLVSGNLDVPNSVVAAVGVAPVVVTVLVKAPSASPLFNSGATVTVARSTDY